MIHELHIPSIAYDVIYLINQHFIRYITTEMYSFEQEYISVNVPSYFKTFFVLTSVYEVFEE